MSFTLPQELLVEIAGYVTTNSWRVYDDRQNLGNFRLVCKAFASAGAKYLTSTVYFSKYPYDLQRLKDISQHPAISKHIINAICDDSRYSAKVFDDLAWESLVRRYTGNAQDPRSKEYRDIYRQIYSDQLRVKEQGLDLAMFCVALSYMPNLRSITVTDNCNGPRFSRSTPVVFSPSWRGAPIPETWPTMASSKALWDQRVTPYHTFITVIRGLSLAKHEIHKLCVEGIDVGISHRIFDASAEDTAHLINVFKDLRQLTLCIATHEAENLWEKDSTPCNLMRKVLARAVHLESLNLNDQAEGGRFDPAFLDFSSLFGQVVWPCLRRFCLGGFEMLDHVGLVQFLMLHRDTLESLLLFDVGLIGSLWATAFADLRRKGFTCGECMLDGLYDEVDDGDYFYSVCGMEVKRYLIEGGENPFLALDT